MERNKGRSGMAAGLDAPNQLGNGDPGRPGERPGKLKALVFARTDSILTQAGRYVVVGGIATLADMGILYLFTSLIGVPYLLSALVGFTAGLIISYSLSIKWVFESRSLSNKTAEFTIFTIIGVTGVGLTEIIMYSCVEFLGLNYMVAKIVAVVVVFAWNFGARRALLFRHVSPAD